MIEHLRLKSKLRVFLCVVTILIALLSSLVLQPLELFYPSVLIAVLLVWMSFIDIERHILPNLLTYGLMIVGLIWASIYHLSDLGHYIIGAIIGYGLIATIAWYYIKKRGIAGIGLGDAKLLAAAGAWLGWVGIPYVLLISSSSGLLLSISLMITKRSFDLKQRIAFGPHLAVGFWLVWLFQDRFSLLL